MTGAQVLTGISELRDALEHLEQQAAVSDDALRTAASSFVFRPDVSKIPKDPFSSEYRHAQLALYESISGRRYATEYEATPFDFDHELRQPYPYGTRSAKTIGDSLIGYGHVIKNLPLAPGKRVLEVGSGYGSLTYHLAGMQLELTCLDLDKRLLDFVARRVANFAHDIEFEVGDVHRYATSKRFDVILFHGSFHHCHDHHLVMRRSHELLAPGGVVAFAAEPIVDQLNDVVPYPWGLRLDGLSLRDVRKHGWLELGFTRYYFLSMLRRLGWRSEERSIPNQPLTHMVLAWRV
jgi:2-polyprenyl-3-methyl-5-hydroxy-6-metoxy-1,4-benzoquinol methylase